MMSKLVKCKACGTDVSKKASACPNCANPMKKGFRLGHFLVLTLFSVFMYSLLFPTPSPKSKPIPVPTTKADITKKTEQLLAELKTIPVKNYSDNLERYQLLLKMHPKNSHYSQKVSFYKAKIKRQKTIESQFSAWNGEHRALGKYVKENLKNPDSYEHVKTVYVDKGDNLLLETTYRATNSFNAVITQKTYAETSIDGSSLKIIGSN